MYYRIEMNLVTDEHSLPYEVAGWQGVFRLGGELLELLERGAQDYEGASRLRIYLREELPEVRPFFYDRNLQYNCWFTEYGYRQFEEVADFFLEALSHKREVKDIRILERDFSQNAVLYEDEYQVAVAA